MVKLDKPEQFLNAEEPIDVTLLGITSSPVKPVQVENAEGPIVVTPLPMVKLDKPEQFLNAEEPIVVTQSPMVTDFNEVLL